MLGVLIVCFILFFHLLLPKTCKSFVCLSNLLLMSVPVEDHSKKRVVRTTLDIYVCIKVVPYTSGKIWSARLIFLFFFGSVFEYIHCNKYQNFNKFQPTDSEL